METISKALVYLSKHNPLKDNHVDQGSYVRWLIEFRRTHGDDAVISMAGYHLWCMKNVKNARDRKVVLTNTFFHDLTGRHNKSMVPRSIGYGEFFNIISLVLI